MYPKGHLGVTLLFSAPIAAAGILLAPTRTGVSLVGVWCGIALAVSRLPDEDFTLKRKVNGLPWPLSAVIPTPKHRGFSHTVFAALILGGVVGGFTGGIGHFAFTTVRTTVPTMVPLAVGVYFGSAVTYGYITHLIGDVITPMGLSPFAPVWQVHLVYTMTIFGERSAAKNEFWNTALFWVGAVAMGAVAILALNIVG